MPEILREKPIPSAPHSKLLLVNHVAARLNMSPRTVRMKAETGQLPGFKLSPESRIWYFKECDIDALLEKQREKFVGDGQVI